MGAAAGRHRGRAPRRRAGAAAGDVRWKADGLDAAGLNLRIGASTHTLGGLLKHLAAVEDHVLGTKLSGAAIGPPWDTEGRDDPFGNGRHTGHADLLREAVDGRVGEDPPPGWRPGQGEA